MSLERFKCVQLSDFIATTSRLDHNPLGPPMLIRSKSNIADTDDLMMIRACYVDKEPDARPLNAAAPNPSHRQLRCQTPPSHCG